VPLREVPDGNDLLGRHPDIDELFKGSVGRDHSERPVPGSDEFDGRSDDPLEDDGELELFDYRLVCSKERAKPALDLQDVPGSRHEIIESEVELSARLVREVD
jgi:hypothetical protein